MTWSTLLKRRKLNSSIFEISILAKRFASENIIRSDGIGFFILHGDILQTVFSTLLHSTTFMSFSGRLYFHLRKRLQLMKMVEKGHKGSKIGF